MRVKELIAELKNMPQNLEVFTSAHDNLVWELSGDILRVRYHKKSDYLEEVANSCDKYAEDMFARNPKEWVSIHS